MEDRRSFLFISIKDMDRLLKLFPTANACKDADYIVRSAPVTDGKSIFIKYPKTLPASGVYMGWITTTSNDYNYIKFQFHPAKEGAVYNPLFLDLQEDIETLGKTIHLKYRHKPKQIHSIFSFFLNQIAYTNVVWEKDIYPVLNSINGVRRKERETNTHPTYKEGGWDDVF